MACNYDYRKLRGRIKEKFGTQSEFSKKLGLSEVSVSNKLNNIVDWDRKKWRMLYLYLKFPILISMHIFLHMKLRKTQLSNEYRKQKSEVRKWESYIYLN
ncbi:DUF739 family protein [Coprococcus comes]|uniref:DUF739 family protein n=1 Tax=Coprococcus comes TaxID=410072 RepID=UPI001A9B0045|nr:DUF739 family protein [Coprococcus comes]MDC0798834.1 DUF739 family protein [Coprococcus comes]